MTLVYVTVTNRYSVSKNKLDGSWVCPPTSTHMNTKYKSSIMRCHFTLIRIDGIKKQKITGVSKNVEK